MQITRRTLAACRADRALALMVAARGARSALSLALQVANTFEPALVP